MVELLEKRLAIIADSDLRERDPDGQLEQLKSVSKEIVAAQNQFLDKFTPRLRHFFEGCSYDKALVYLREGNS